jgi:outer membrane protein OmpA-like peptidoglycan-associated protein/curli biogenesis system outer membrane secretion channel CsgG
MSRFRVSLLSLFLAVSVLFWFGLATADMGDKVTYQGNKARITVGTIKSKADCSSDEAAAIGEMLSTALANNDKFIVLASQEEVDELIDEIDLGESEYVESGRGPEKGLMEGADILVTGAVTGFEPDAGGGGGALGGLTKKAFGGAGLSKKTAQINMDIKLIDIRTRRIIKALSLEAKSSKWKAGATGGGWTKDIAMAGALGAYSNEPMEDAIREVLRDAVNQIAKETPKEYFRYSGEGRYTSEYGSSGSTGGGGDQEVSKGGATAPGKKVAEDMKLYTKYDFVPGDKVIFYDDMKGEEEGEFPSRWNLDQGVYEVVHLGKELWIMCTDDGKITPKIPRGPLPEKYTVELEFYNHGPDKSGNYFYINWIDADGRELASTGIYGNDQTWLEILDKSVSDKTLSRKLGKGIHTYRIMATQRSIKCYVDEERVANVPAIENFNPVGFQLRHTPYRDPDNPTLFRGFRFAEGGKSMREQLDADGKIVTHGILFDVNSSTIKGESYKTLKDIGELLQEDPSLRLSIEGHTDSDGTEESNQILSQSRAESVRTYLINNYNVDGDRLEVKGWGETRAIDTNNTPEGKANNRRVELVKI